MGCWVGIDPEGKCPPRYIIALAPRLNLFQVHDWTALSSAMGAHLHCRRTDPRSISRKRLPCSSAIKSCHCRQPLICFLLLQISLRFPELYINGTVIGRLWCLVSIIAQQMSVRLYHNPAWQQRCYPVSLGRPGCPLTLGWPQGS